MSVCHCIYSICIHKMRYFFYFYNIFLIFMADCYVTLSRCLLYTREGTSSYIYSWSSCPSVIINIRSIRCKSIKTLACPNFIFCSCLRFLFAHIWSGQLVRAGPIERQLNRANPSAPPLAHLISALLIGKRRAQSYPAFILFAAMATSLPPSPLSLFPSIIICGLTHSFFAHLAYAEFMNKSFAQLDMEYECEGGRRNAFWENGISGFTWCRLTSSLMLRFN